MEFQTVEISQRAARVSDHIERVANRAVRTWDRALGALHLGGRKGPYDDERYEFVGGAKDAMRKKHYDKSLRLLWKAEAHAPWTSFRDCSTTERQLLDMAEEALSPAEKSVRDEITTEAFKESLNRHYTREQKEAIVALLAPIGHGEAYAWMVSAEVMSSMRSTGARAALTMQILEEAKHFVVLRELIRAFDVPVPRQSAWEYLLLEQVHKAEGLEKLFGMNVLVEGIALSLFGMMSHMPGLELLRLFHLDESRHTALPVNYFEEFPMSRWQRRNPLRRANRLRLILPAVPLIFLLERPAAVGIRVASSVCRIGWTGPSLACCCWPRLRGLPGSCPGSSSGGRLKRFIWRWWNR